MTRVCEALRSTLDTGMESEPKENFFKATHKVVIFIH